VFDWTVGSCHLGLARDPRNHPPPHLNGRAHDRSQRQQNLIDLLGHRQVISGSLPSCVLNRHFKSFWSDRCARALRPISPNAHLGVHNKAFL